MAAPKIVTPTKTPIEEMRPKAAGRWPNRNEQAVAKGSAK